MITKEQQLAELRESAPARDAGPVGAAAARPPSCSRSSTATRRSAGGTSTLLAHIATEGEQTVSELAARSASRCPR